MKTTIVIVCVTGLFIYLTIGGFVFHLLESSVEAKKYTAKTYHRFRDKLLAVNPNYDEFELEKLEGIIEEVIHAATVEDEANHSVDVGNQWDFYNSFFVATTIVTTIGYGHLAPVSDGGRIFSCFYALFGIPLFLIAAAGVGVKLKLLANALSRRLFCDEEHPLSRLAEYVRGALLISLALGCFLLVPAFVFHRAEGWTFWNGLYYSYITLTTIGFGDHVAGQNTGGEWTGVYRFGISLWILVGLAWMASFISEMTDIYCSVIDIGTGYSKDKAIPDPPNMDGELDESNSTETGSDDGDEDCVSLDTQDSNCSDDDVQITDDVILDMNEIKYEDGDADIEDALDDAQDAIGMNDVINEIENEAFMEMKSIEMKMR